MPMTKAEQVEFLRRLGHAEIAGMIERGEVRAPSPDAFDTSRACFAIADALRALADGLTGEPTRLLQDGSATVNAADVPVIRAALSLAAVDRRHYFQIDRAVRFEELSRALSGDDS